MKKITKAIIPVAGYGTRMLPITKVLEKHMLPVGNRPIVDYTVEDCIKAGITDIYFAVGEQSAQLRQYYGHNQDLEEFLLARGKDEMLAKILPPDDVNFHYTVVRPNGNAVAVAEIVKEFEINESVAILMGDDLFHRSDGGSELVDLVAEYRDGEGVFLGVPIAPENKTKYGFLNVADGKLTGIAEAVTIDEAPSNLINVNRYIMPAAFLHEVVKYTEQPIDMPEYYITTVPFDNFIKQGGVVRVLSAKGEYLDSGNLSGWLHANEVVGRDLLKS